MAETAEGVVAGRPLALAMLDIHTVGAGGGSIAWRDPGGALRVGPHSAGADPGPACYGRGGEHPTVTDANLLLGRLPADVPLAGGLRLDRDAAERAIAALAATLDLSTTRCAEGIVHVAEAAMARALRTITVERGIDPRGFALMPFGGAGPLHAAALARELGMRRILVPRASGVLCALGLAAAAPRRDTARTVMLTGESLNAERLGRRARGARGTGVRGARRAGRARRSPLRAALPRAVVRAGSERRRTVRWTSGQRTTSGAGAGGRDTPQAGQVTGARTSAPAARPRALREAFAQAHEQRYGYRDDGVEVELVTIRVSAWGAAPRLRLASTEASLRRARGSRGPRCAPCRAPPCMCQTGGGARSTTTAPCTCTTREPARDPRPDRAAGAHRRAARRVRGDGRRADPLRALAQHQGAPRLLHRAVRCARGRW